MDCRGGLPGWIAGVIARQVGRQVETVALGRERVATLLQLPRTLAIDELAECVADAVRDTFQTLQRG